MLALGCCQLIPDTDRTHAVHGPSSRVVGMSYNVLRLALRSSDDDLGESVVIQRPDILQNDNNNSRSFASIDISTSASLCPSICRTGSRLDSIELLLPC